MNDLKIPELATEEGYPGFVKALAAPADTLRFDGANLLIDQLKALAGPGLILDHLKRSLAYDAKLRMNNTPVSEDAAPTHAATEANLIHALLGIITEAFELAPVLIDLLEGRAIDTTNLIEELGDGQFYTQLAASSLIPDEDSMGVVRRKNVAKLLKRYEELQFSRLAAITRNENREVEAMEYQQ